MTEIESRLWNGHYYDHMNGVPLQSGDPVKVHFPSGHVIETTIYLKGKVCGSSPGYGDTYEFEACIKVPYYGVMGYLSLREYPELKIERIKPSRREKSK